MVLLLIVIAAALILLSFLDKPHHELDRWEETEKWKFPKEDNK